ncbi:MAG TPA: oligopeptide/dipeptide ABC transporter ATP-binding protein [Acidobacteriota bacterium]|nr:oligopeptide/dipeptide ABC transporter ATP-binding protein [Acidobacteriota bacterium]
MSTERTPAPLCEVRELKKHFPVLRGFLRKQVASIQAVDGVSFDIFPGETLGLVGESGSGKTTTGRAVLQLDEPTSGQVVFEGEDLTRLEPADLRRARRHMQMIFQDPFASLNPRRRVDETIAEPLDIHDIGSPQSRSDRVGELLELVGLDTSFTGRYPHELSGGQRQRVGIARALATSPRFIVADEPISALDVSIQAQVVNLLSDLKDDLGLTYLFIAHDLSMVRHLSDRIAVMYLGRIVELGDRDGIFERPLHPYTQALVAAIPQPDPDAAPERHRARLEGEVPSPMRPPPGCRFHTRCPYATDICSEQDPEYRTMGDSRHPGDHWVACHHAERIEAGETP